MAKSITIRDVPDATSDELAARAALTGRSLQEFLRGRLIELAASPDAEVVVARIRARKAATRTSLTTQDILADRDAERRDSGRRRVGRDRCRHRRGPHRGLGRVL